MLRSIYSIREADLDDQRHVEDDGTTTGRDALVFDVYSDSNDGTESSSDNNLDLIFAATSQLRAKFWRGSQPTELPDCSRVVASIEDLPYQHSRPLSSIQEGRSGEIVLVDSSSEFGDNLRREWKHRGGKLTRSRTGHRGRPAPHG